VSLTSYFIHFRFNTIPWANVSSNLGTEVDLIDHFLAVSLLDEKSCAIDVQDFSRDDADALLHSCSALLDARRFGVKAWVNSSIMSRLTDIGQT